MLRSVVDSTPDLVHLTLLNDADKVMGILLWRQEAPAIVPVAWSNGVLNREGIEALHRYCEEVLRCMDALEE